MCCRNEKFRKTCGELVVKLSKVQGEHIKAFDEKIRPHMYTLKKRPGDPSGITHH